MRVGGGGGLGDFFLHFYLLFLPLEALVGLFILGKKSGVWIESSIIGLHIYPLAHSFRLMAGIVDILHLSWDRSRFVFVRSTVVPLVRNA